MEKINFDTLCENVLKATLKNFSTAGIRSYNIKSKKMPSNNIIYNGAVRSASPVTLVYTPAGSGTTQLINDRIDAIIKAGEEPGKIMVLNMNVSKCRQTRIKRPDVQVDTFTNFIQRLFDANYPDFEVTDPVSMANFIRLMTDDKKAWTFADIMDVPDKKERMMLLTTYVNKNMKAIDELLSNVRRCDFGLQSLVCQNLIYKFKNNPFDVNALVVNGIHNLSLPILCTIMCYAQKYKCNLYMTGDPSRGIYDFNLAYPKSMDLIDSLGIDGINTIRLRQNTRISKEISNLINLCDGSDLHDVTSININTYNEPLEEAIAREISLQNNSYIRTLMEEGEPLLVLTRSKNDALLIEDIMKNTYPADIPDINITSLVTETTGPLTYARVAVDLYHELKETNPKITLFDFVKAMKKRYKEIIALNDDPYITPYYSRDYADMKSYFEHILPEFGSYKNSFDIYTLVFSLIDIESKFAMKEYELMHEIADSDISESDIVITTIHAAIDLCCDNAIVMMNEYKDGTNHNLCRAAFSRANKTEQVIFANKGVTKNEYQQYIERHT